MASSTASAADDASADRRAASSAGRHFGAIASAAALGLAGWALGRTVEHESRLAALAENRAAAVLEARLEGLSVRLSRIEASTEAINQKLDTYR